MMESNIVQYQSKIQDLFERFLEPNFEIKNDTYLSRLLTHLSSQEETVNSAAVDIPIMTEWLIKAVSLWETNTCTASVNITAFTLNLTALLSKCENTFLNLNNHNFYSRLVQVVKATQPEAAPSIRLGYIKLLDSFLEHKPGIQLIETSIFWEDVLKFTLTNQTIYITRDGRRFMSRLLDQAGSDENQRFLFDVVKRITQPLCENIYKRKTMNDVAEIADEHISKLLTPSLQLISNILEYFLKNVVAVGNDCRVVLIFTRDCHLEQKISDLLMIAQNKELIFELGKIIFVLQFLELYIGVTTGTLTSGHIVMCIRQMFSIFTANISKGNYENVLRFTHYGHMYWSILGHKVPTVKVNKDNEPISFGNQLIVLQMLPIVAIRSKYIKTGKCETADDFRDQFTQKLYMAMCETTVRIAYSWRDFLLAENNLFEIAIKSLTYLMKSRQYFPRERAATAFQFLIYSLKDVVYSVKRAPEALPIFLEQSAFLSLLFDAIKVFIEEFSITWRDSVETICVMGVCFEFLNIPTWPSQLVIKALTLVNTSIVKYMSPNLALLIDRTTDSTMGVMGPLLVAKLHDPAWEVRDSTLEVIHTIAHMSNSEFPSLQRVLLDSELPSLVVKMSSCDGESFVRSTAIKCLQKMIQVDEIWKNVLQSENLSEKMRQILLSETEGIVRVEAATFMRVAYEHHQFPKEALDAVYEIMVHSSTTDLHWEVKVRSLEFWDKVIQSHLQHQGMIDGHFPAVTFSREHRKIVTLTDSEIRKRLHKVLSQLSAIGCLGVLVSAIQDDCDIEVSKTAVTITQTLAELFKKYNLRSDLSTATSPQPTEYGMSSAISSVSSGISVEDSMDVPSTSSELNEEIIEQIVSSKDISLLKNVYTSSDYGSVANYDFQVRKIVRPNEFLEFTQQDLNNIIIEKKNWLNGIEDLGSLLDDMLKKYDDDVNNMDCY